MNTHEKRIKEQSAIIKSIIKILTNIKTNVKIHVNEGYTRYLIDNDIDKIKQKLDELKIGE